MVATVSISRLFAPRQKACLASLQKQSRDNNKWIFFSLQSHGDSFSPYFYGLERLPLLPFFPVPPYLFWHFVASLTTLSSLGGQVPLVVFLYPRLNRMDNEPFDDKRSSSFKVPKVLKSIEETLWRLSLGLGLTSCHKWLRDIIPWDKKLEQTGFLEVALEAVAEGLSRIVLGTKIVYFH